jgi:hypothetical protein
MKIELVKDEAAFKSGESPVKTAGWNIIGETEEERRILGTMRDFYFWGIEETSIQYDGMSEYPEDRHDVGQLHFRTAGFVKRRKKYELKRLQDESNETANSSR